MTTILYILFGIVVCVAYFAVCSVIGRFLAGTRKWDE